MMLKTALLRWLTAPQAPRWVGYCLWGITATVAGHWLALLLSPTPHIMARPVLASPTHSAEWIRAFALPDNLVTVLLHGLVSPDAAWQRGVALLSVDNGPAQAYVPGREVATGIILQQVGPHSVTLMRQTGTQTLTLAPPPTLTGVTLVLPRPR